MEKRVHSHAAMTSIVLLGVLLIMPAAGLCQPDSSPIFIAYGTIYRAGTSEPIDLPYAIEVENTRNGLTNYTTLGASGDVGTFSVVLIDYGSSDAVQTGDTVVVRVKPLKAPNYLPGTTFIIDQNGFQNKMMYIDFEFEDPFGVQAKSWSIIKKIFRAKS
jgi:hypothetical protein